MNPCFVCHHHVPENQSSADRVFVDDAWRLALAFDSSLPGWLCVLPQRHVTGLHELTDAEASAMGPLLRAGSSALVNVTGCAKTYVMLFAEQEGFAHLHFHLVPRHADLPVDRRGPAVFGYLGADPADRPSQSEQDALADRLGRELTRVLGDATIDVAR